MASPHFVCDFAFDVSFPSEAVALAQHNRIGSFVSVNLMTVADQVFSKLAPADGSIVRIETLDINLGHIPESSYYEEAETRFRERLEEAVRQKLMELGGV